MINASYEFKEQINKGIKLVNYADITLKDGTVLNLGPSDFVVGGCSISDKATNGKFNVGNTVGKILNLTVSNYTNKFSSYDFYKSIIYLYVAIELEDGRVLKERKGKYYVSNPTSPGKTISLSCVDSMYLFDRPYNSKTAFPANLLTILSDCCLECGVNIGFGEFDNWNFVVYNRPEDCTYREVVSWVSQIAGYNARISVNDALELVWYEITNENSDNVDGGNFFYTDTVIYDGGDFIDYTSGDSIDGGSFTDKRAENINKIKSISISTDDVIITGVKIKTDTKEYLYGTEDYSILVDKNPFAELREEEIAEYLGKRLIGLKFRPMSCQITNHPFIEPYDSCYVYDRENNTYFALINSVNYTISGFTTIECKAEDPIRNESSYVSEAAKAVAKARRDTNNQLTLYDKAVQNMNLLAANAMGLYRESENQSDGSVIYYMSNRPIIKNDDGICEFELNSVVYKMTGDGFFVSEDGGLSYTSGFDANGNAIVNVLSAIGITFDWARGGTLSLGGDNDINGSMIVYDAENNIVGKFNNDGLWANNGYFKGDIVSTNAYITGGQINITTSAQTYDTIQLKHGTDIIKISPSYLYQKDTYGILQITPSGFASGNGSTFQSSTEYSSLRQGTLSLTHNGSSSYIQGGFARFANVHTSSETLESYFSGPVAFSKETKVYGNLTVHENTSLKGDLNVGISSSDKLGFFGGLGSIKKTVSAITMTSTATASSNATKINEVISALKAYNLL